MNNKFLLYGNDLAGITNCVQEIANNADQEIPCEIETIELKKSEDLNTFYDKEINLSLFRSNKLLRLLINLRTVKTLDKNIDEFITKISAMSTTCVVVIVIFSQMLDKKTKESILQSKLFKLLGENTEIKEFAKLRYWQKDLIKDKAFQMANKLKERFPKFEVNEFLELAKEDEGYL